MMRVHRRTRANSIGISIAHLFCLITFVVFGASSSASELVFSNYHFGDLRLSYQPPKNDGGEPVTKYKVEWDAASENNAHLPSFTPTSPHFGSSEITHVREEQEIVLSCPSICSGTFALSWGGRVSVPLDVDVTSDDLEVAIKELVEPFILEQEQSPVRVTRKTNGFGYKWKVVFPGIDGDIGLIRADGDLLVGGGAAIRVTETIPGSSDIYPGSYTNEIQTVSVRKQRGFDCESLDGSFALEFEGKSTDQISVNASSDDFKAALELLETIHTVNVNSDHHYSSGSGDCASRSWIVTFTHLVHENRQGAGDLGLLGLSSSSLVDPTVTHVDIFENIKGTNPISFSIRGLQYGLAYHCRVSAYNSLGYGVSSSIVTATPVIQPPPPNNTFVSIPDPDTIEEPGTSLLLSWDAIGADMDNNGGDPVSEYKVEWYSSIGKREIQKLTTSSSDGITEIQSIKISADSVGITGFFTVVFDGESSDLIPHDVDADGAGSLEVKLERLSTIGDVEVSRDLSWASVPQVEFDLMQGSNVLERVGDGSTSSLVELFSAGDSINVGGEHHVVSSVTSSFINLSDAYTGPSANNVIIHKWSYGYEWRVTFNSHIGEQPLLEVHPADNWAGANPVIEVARVRKGAKPLSGMMRLGFEGERTLPIPFDADAQLMKQALESLTTIGEVGVTRYTNNNGHNYFVTFLSELGNRDQITVDDSTLMGPDARARVATMVDGTEPSDYGNELIPHPTMVEGSSSLQYQIKDLENGVPYYVRIRSRNAKGFGYATMGIPSPTAPIQRPPPPTSISMFPLSAFLIRVVWESSDHNGGSPIEKYVLQWDTDPSFPNAWNDGYFREVFVDSQDDGGIRYCDDFSVPPSLSSTKQYARVLSFNGYRWSDPTMSVVLSTTAVIGKAGPVIDFNVFPTSSSGIMMTWMPPSASHDNKSCGYAGDGGSPITQYMIEYDSEADFASPATSFIVPSTKTSFRIGGRDVISGSESTMLETGGTYYARITAFNAEGSGTTVTFPTAVGPLTDTAPGAPLIRNAVPVSASSVKVEWDTPTLDGGIVLQEYIIEYDTTSTFDSTPKNVSVPVVSEVKGLQIGTIDLNLNIQTIQATVAVTNEVQSVKTEIDGVDEIQEVSTTCDDVVAEVQMIVTNAVDTNEEQVVSLISDDVDEIQLVRLHANDQVEIQSVKVSNQRVNEVQKFGIVISNINTDGDGVHSTACMGIDVGDPCPDIETALSGSFTVSFDFDECGGDGVNYCQLALLEYEPDLGTVVCSPGLVLDPYSGGDHCVSEPVSSYSHSTIEGEPGTLQRVINDLVDDNGVPFMTLQNTSLGKKDGVTVTRVGRIKTKGSCTLDPMGASPAICSGEYELVYEISFDAVQTSGDVPPLTIVASDFRLDATSSSFVNDMCPTDYYVNGCDNPTGAAASSEYGSFYDGESGSVAFETMKGSQPSGMVSLDYECESRVVHLPESFSMSIYNDGMSASFDSDDFVSGMSLGQWIRFSNGDGIDFYRKIQGIDVDTNSVELATRAPTNGISYQDVEFGDYFSDWDGSNGDSGVSSYCMASRIYTTLPLDVDVNNESNSVVDWKGKIGALPIIEASGISVSRSIVSDLMSEVGLRWEITFQKQPGHVHQMLCHTVLGDSDCTVETTQDSSLIDGYFKLQTTWPHEYVSENIEVFETDAMRWNIDSNDVKASFESISDSNGNKVFGLVSVTRSPYIPPTHSRWSGGYQWVVTFLSRGGNIPAMMVENSALTGIDVTVEISDEDSGASDLFQGLRNSAAFSNDDPNLSRDGNQVSGSFSLLWGGNMYHTSVETGEVFHVQTGGSSSDRFTALSAEGFKSIFEEFVLGNASNQIDVIRSEHPTQWMGYTYTILFRHEDVGGDVPRLVHMLGVSLYGQNSYVRIDESVKGTEIAGTFQLRFEGETTRPINYDATALDVQEALNELNSIAPSAVVVSGSDNPVRSGPSDGIVGMSTQVGGRIWYVTFASNTWKDPTLAHDASFVPGNWVGPPASYLDTWNSGFSKAWGKNVGNVPMISCLSSGLTSTNGALPDDGCSVHEIVSGTNPLGGVFKLCMDSVTNPNGVMSVESDVCTDYIAHNAVASAEESGGDGTSVEEKLEQLENIGDVHVTRSEVNTRNGGYTWKVTFLHDADGPCEQKDDIHSLCNSPGDVPKLCSGSTACDTSSLLGTCLNPNSCHKLGVLDMGDRESGQHFPSGNEKQAVFVKDVDYLGWEGGSVVSTAESKEFILVVGGVETSCIQNSASADDMRLAVQTALNGGIGGIVRVERNRSEDSAQNGYAYYLTFYDTGDIDALEVSPSSCARNFEASQSVEVLTMIDGSLHPYNCNDCADGIVQRGEITTLEVDGDNLSGKLAWNADPASVKAHLEQMGSRTVVTSRSILDKYGTVQWTITFTENAESTPPGTGDIQELNVTQGPDTSNRNANILVNEITKGSEGLSGTFDLDYASLGGPRSFSYDETPARMLRKLEEMSTIGSVYVSKDCFPSCDSGGWGGSAVTPGTIGGYKWTINFLKNPGSDNGVTFPPGCGYMSPPTIDDSNLLGNAASVAMSSPLDGSAPLLGTFRLTVNERKTAPIPYNAAASTLEQSINDLRSVGDVTVSSGMQASHLIPGIRANVVTDSNVASINGGDLRKHFAPGDLLRIGGSITEIDGADFVGSVSLTPLSPVLTNVQLNAHRNVIHAGEEIRAGGDTYTVMKNGIEVQLIALHRSKDISNGDFFQLRVTINGVTEITSCITFDSTASDLETALNRLSILSNNGGVLVTRTNDTSGYTGSAHLYRVHFVGGGLIGDVAEMVAEECSSGIVAGVNSSNSHVHIRTLVQGGKTEHQRITLSSDYGSTSDTPAFQLSIFDSNFNSWTSPCIVWGAPSLGLASSMDVDIFSSAVLSVGPGGVINLGDGQYRIEASSFVEGIVLPGDYVNPGQRCPGHVVSIEEDGKSILVESTSGCASAYGDELLVGSDISIIESFTNHGMSTSEVTVVEIYSTDEIMSSAGLYRLTVELGGVSKSTECIPIGASAEDIQKQIGLMFDFNQDGVINAFDRDHITVVQLFGNGTSASGFGYSYKFISSGSKSTFGSSEVLGSNAPKFSISNVGADGGCEDYGVNRELITNTASTSDESDIVSLDVDAMANIVAGARIRISSSLASSKIYTVDHIRDDDMSIVLTETFLGSSTTGSVSIHTVSGGMPLFSVEVIQEGFDEHVYDLFFTGSHWSDVPQIHVNNFGDGTCSASNADIIDGMNRNIVIKTVVNGGGTIDSVADSYVVDRIAKHDQGGLQNLYVVPPILAVNEFSSEVQRIIVMDDGNESIWGSGMSSYKLSFSGEYTGCISYDASEEDLEYELNSISSICTTATGPCVTVTRREDALLAPNGFVYTLYFDSESAANRDIFDSAIENGLEAYTSHSDCVAFDSVGGEQIVITTLRQGSSSQHFTSNQLPFRETHVDRWIGESQSDLPIYRISGMYWLIRFGQSLGSVTDISIDSSSLSPSAQFSILNVHDGMNPGHVTIPKLLTGIPYYFRVYAKNSNLAISSHSNTARAIPSDRPEAMRKVIPGYALHQEEVQKIVLAATHQKEVQTITTSAISIPEVQEITLEGTEDSDMNSYLFSLRYPEIQVVKWSAGSPVTSGSFFLKLRYADMMNSNLSGSLVYNEMKSACIPFDATAEEVKHAIEIGALSNPLGLNSVRVLRSGSRSFSSGYGFEYKIYFEGSNVRGNMLEMSSDLTLSGLDSIGGMSCDAFVSSTNDASLEIWTENESFALGTDTPSVELAIDSNVQIEEGEFQLSVTHLGQELLTPCISWDVGPVELELALETLANIDSVRVDVRGSGSGFVVYFDGNAMHTAGVSYVTGYMPLQGTNFDVVEPNSCISPKAYHNHALKQVSEIPGGIAIVRVVSKYDGKHTLPGAPSSESSTAIRDAILATLPMRIQEAQVAESLETAMNGMTFTITYGNEDGNLPLLVCNQPETTSLVSCKTSTVMDANEIRGNFYLESSDAIPHDASPSELESAISKVPGVGSVDVTRSHADGQGGYTWNVTFSGSNGDVPILRASNSLTGKGATVSVVESTKGNQLGGSFTLSFASDTTSQLPFDVDTETLAAALEALDGIGSVEVSTTGDTDSELGRTFLITFLDAEMGDVPILTFDHSNLTGLGAAISVTEHVKGSAASRSSLHFSLDHPRGCSSSDVGRAFCGSPIIEDVIELSPISDFGGPATHVLRHSPDYSVQTIRTMYTGTEPLDYLGGYFNIEYSGSQSVPISAHASADDVRFILEDLRGIDTASVTRSFAHQSLPGVCVDVSVGSSSVECSASCSPCNFAEKGIKANRLIRIGEKWQRVSSYYDGVTENFDIASIDDSTIKTSYVGDNDLSGWDLQIWTGGYEWTVVLLKVDGDVKPLTSPKHHMLPREAAIEVAPKDCNKCIFASSLSPGTEYYIRAKSMNEIGWSDYSDLTSEIPRGIPTAPENVHVTAISGTCLEVTFDPPHYDYLVSSYVIQWDDNESFSDAESDSASCSSFGYGSCVISQSSPPPYRNELCGLDEAESYYVRVAARNSVPTQFIHHPSGVPMDNTQWSASVLAVTSDQVPGPPTSLELLILGRESLQVLFKWPEREGGKLISDFAIMYDTSPTFSSSNTLIVSSSIPSVIPDSGGKYVFDFTPTTPRLVAGELYFLKLIAINSVGAGAESEVISGVPSGPSDPPYSATLTTLDASEFPITTANIFWTSPSSNGGYPVNGYLVEWWTKEDTIPEVQLVRLHSSSQLFDTTFSLSFSPTPTVKKETPNLPWNAPASLVRRELLNLGWDESNDLMLISDVEVTRSNISNGFEWRITFGGNPDRSISDGDMVSLSASAMSNGDSGSPLITISTLQDGQRQGGLTEVQYLQVTGNGVVSGHYRLKFAGSEWSSFIPIHSNASYIKNALEQLSTIGDVDVLQNDYIDTALVGTGDDLIHHYEIHFVSNPGNVEALVVDSAHVASTEGEVSVVVYDGSNSMNVLNTKASATSPGELPAHYDNSGILDSLTESYEITGLQTGKEYFVAVSASNAVHGLSKRLVPFPSSVSPPIQAPESPRHVALSVNRGFSDSLIVDFDAPSSDGGSDVLFYRVELDPTPSFDYPIVQDFHCPPNNRRTEWQIETSTDDNGGVISGGSFRLELEVDGFTSITASIPYDAVALASNETGISEELIPTFSTTTNSNVLATIPPTSIEGKLFPGDRLRFSGQSMAYKYYHVQSVANTSATLTEGFTGDEGVQVSTTRYYGGRGSPLSSRIHCHSNEDLCPVDSEAKSGSLQSKLEDLSPAIQNGVFIDRDGPNEQNGFIWRITFLDDAHPAERDYTLRVHSNSLTATTGAGHVTVSLLNSGKTYTSCTGSLVVPSLGGLVKGLHYYARVSARNKEGYSLPNTDENSAAPMIVPSAPTGVTLEVISATQLRVMFGSPSDNGGDTITNYMIEWSTSSDFANADSSTHDYLAGGSPFFKNIEGLSTGIYYYVRVRAMNSQGYGISQSSTPSSLNPHQKPSPPTNVRLGVTSDSMLTIGWSPPLTDGGDSIAKYRIEWDTNPRFVSASQPPNKGYVDLEPSSRSYTVGLLSQEKSYYMRVFAINSAGSSQAQMADPSWAFPRMQIPGVPYSLICRPGDSSGVIEFSWQRPNVPNHGIHCFSDKDCPTPYGGSLPQTDGGENISEYELEVNERPDYTGIDGRIITLPGLHSNLNNLYPGRMYYGRILARNSVGSGKYSTSVSCSAPL